MGFHLGLNQYIPQEIAFFENFADNAPGAATAELINTSDRIITIMSVNRIMFFFIAISPFINPTFAIFFA
jgi:hypothetical protein